MIRTAECVSPKHPDKMCDRISDTILDLYLQSQGYNGINKQFIKPLWI